MYAPGSFHFTPQPHRAATGQDGHHGFRREWLVVPGLEHGAKIENIHGMNIHGIQACLVDEAFQALTAYSECLRNSRNIFPDDIWISHIKSAGIIWQ